VRSKIRWFTEFCNSHYLSHFAAFFIDAGTKRSVVESFNFLHCVSIRLRLRAAVFNCGPPPLPEWVRGSNMEVVRRGFGEGERATMPWCGTDECVVPGRPSSGLFFSVALRRPITTTLTGPALPAVLSGGAWVVCGVGPPQAGTFASKVVDDS
jgi:hypothetical protein